MPPVIDTPADAGPCSLAECSEALDTIGLDADDPASIAAAAHWLRRLANNREFLGEVLVKRLAGGGEDGLDSSYGPQAIMLSRPHASRPGAAFLRAAIWPSPADHVFQTSGAASFVYGAPHDHNFDFLTVGYCGPGYASEYYEYDYEALAGYPGEVAGLRHTGRATLLPGKVLLYRRHVDVHSQLPPESLSVSLNVMRVEPAQGWFDQYGFDLARGTVARWLNARRAGSTPMRPKPSCASRSRAGPGRRWTMPNGSARTTRATACASPASKRAPDNAPTLPRPRHCGGQRKVRAAGCWQAQRGRGGLLLPQQRDNHEHRDQHHRRQQQPPAARSSAAVGASGKGRIGDHFDHAADNILDHLEHAPRQPVDRAL